MDPNPYESPQSEIVRAEVVPEATPRDDVGQVLYRVVGWSLLVIVVLAGVSAAEEIGIWELVLGALILLLYFLQRAKRAIRF